MRAIVLTSLLLLGAAAAWGLTPYRVADINPVFTSGSSEPEGLTTVGGVSLFTANNGVTGRELWRSDGTAAGTYQVMDACEGACDSNPGVLTVAEGRAFLLANDAVGSPWSLWVTDGTRLGTFRLTEGVDVRLDWPPAWVQALHLFFFLADDGVHGTEIWRSDGTPAGTFQVADIRPGALGSGPEWLIPFAGRLFFGADDGIHGPALWSSNGTPAGTRLVKDTVPGSPAHSGPYWITTGKRLFFFTDNANAGSLTLWRSDGTPRGTVPVTSWRVIMEPYHFPQVDDATIATALGDRLLFVLEAGRSGQELWVSDGTAAGTRALTRFPKPEAFVSPISDGWRFLHLPSTALGSRFGVPGGRRSAWAGAVDDRRDAGGDAAGERRVPREVLGGGV